MTIRCITFDLDDTLWACMPVIQAAEARFYHWLKQHRPDIPKRYTLEAMIAHRVTYVKAHPQLHHNLTQLRKDWLKTLSTDCGYPHDWIEDGFNVFWIARNDVKLFSGAEAMLADLAKRYQLGAITNGNSDLVLCGIDRFFDFSVHSEEVGASKPAVEVFDYALNLAGLKAQEVIHVGDDPHKDVVGAKALGMKTIWINFDNNKWPEEMWEYRQSVDAEVRDLSTLVSAVNTIAAS